MWLNNCFAYCIFTHPGVMSSFRNSGVWDWGHLEFARKDLIQRRNMLESCWGHFGSCRKHLLHSSLHSIWDQRSLRNISYTSPCSQGRECQQQRELQVGKELASYAELAVQEASSHQHSRDKSTLACFYNHCPCGCELAIWSLHYKMGKYIYLWELLSKPSPPKTEFCWV